MVHFVVMGGIFIFLAPYTEINFVKIAQAYGVTLALAFGVGVMNSFLTLAYPVWQTVWAIMNRPIFIISCLFFIFESIPNPWSDMLWYNPLVHIVGLMRDGYYPFYRPTYVSIVYPLSIAAILTITGLFLHNRYHREILLK